MDRAQTINESRMETEDQVKQMEPRDRNDLAKDTQEVEDRIRKSPGLLLLPASSPHLPSTL